jgi:hypothetical protein
VCQAINAQLVETYWQIGQQIVEFEQGGQIQALASKNQPVSEPADLTRDSYIFEFLTIFTQCTTVA